MPAPDPVTLASPDFVVPWDDGPAGPLVVPGEYTVTLAKRERGELVELDGPERFVVKSLPQSPETSGTPADVLAFQRKAAELYRAVTGSIAHAAELDARIEHLKIAIPATPAAGEAEEQALRDIESRLADVMVTLAGDKTVASRNEPAPWSIENRAGVVYSRLLYVRSDVPGLYEDSYAIAADEFAGALARLRSIGDDLAALEERLESLGAPYTPGRVPGWDY
jgi:hypothetical protein